MTAEIVSILSRDGGPTHIKNEPYQNTLTTGVLTPNQTVLGPLAGYKTSWIAPADRSSWASGNGSLKWSSTLLLVSSKRDATESRSASILIADTFSVFLSGPVSFLPGLTEHPQRRKI